jgi:HlyD family secretion protein
MKKPILISIIAIIIAASVGGYFLFGRKQAAKYEFTDVAHGDITQEVSVTGKVQPAQKVDLSFEKSGKITQAGFKVGDQVKSGQVLAALENSDVNAQLMQARAGVQAQQAKLDELKKGTRSEDIQVSQTSVNNYQQSLDNAKTSLEAEKNSADTTLQSDYDSSLTAASRSINVALNSLFTLTDLQYGYFAGYDQNAAQVESAKEKAVFALLGSHSAGRATKDALNIMNGGARSSVQTAQAEPSQQNIDQALADVLSALNEIKSTLNAVPIISDFSSADLLALSTEKSNINAEIITLAGKQQAISVQKAANQSSIASAEASVTTAQNNLANAQANLNLKQAGSAPEEIAAQEAQVRQAQANLANIQSTYSKTVIQAPVDGTLTLQDAKKGEMATPNKTVISIISNAKFEVEANIPEADIAKVKLEDTAKITLDAYGGDVNFPAKVVSIDPGETVVEGVATYKTKFQFINEDDRIKSGMTANIDILTDSRKNVVIVPQRAIITKNNDKFVLLAPDQNNPNASQMDPVETKIETGLKGSDGNIEIISGLKEGDKIVSFGGVTQ